MSQQAQQMQSAQQPMNHVAQQLAMMTNAASVASLQQTPNVETQVDWSTKIAEVMREQFSLRPKQQSVMYKTLRLTIRFLSHTSTRCLIPLSFQGKERFLPDVGRALPRDGRAPARSVSAHGQGRDACPKRLEHRPPP